jgi:hypothetical protein
MITTQAQKAFDLPLAQLGVDESIKVCRENIDCPTDESVPFLAGFLLASDQSSADLSVNELVDGLYQVDVNYSSHLGSSPINKMIDKVGNLFKIGSDHFFDGECFGVESLSVSPLLVDGGWGKKSLTITFSAYTTV